MSIELTKEELAAAEAGRKARLEPNNGGKWREPHPQYSSPVARGRVARGLSPFEPRVVKPNPEEVRKDKEEFSKMRADLNNPVIDTTLEYEEPIEVSAAVEAGRKVRGVTSPAKEATVQINEQPKGLNGINISNEGIVETTLPKAVEGKYLTKEELEAVELGRKKRVSNEDTTEDTAKPMDESQPNNANIVSIVNDEPKKANHDTSTKSADVGIKDVEIKDVFDLEDRLYGYPSGVSKRRYEEKKRKEEQEIEEKEREENSIAFLETDPYKNQNQFAVNLPNSADIDYGKEQEIEDKTGKPATSEADVVPHADAKETEEEKSDLAFMDEYWKNLYTDADREADEKRKKAAKWITAAQMLGDSIAALGNSYFTAKGANAMKVEPGAQKAAAATSQLEQDIRNAREKAAKAQYDATLKKYEMEMQRQDKKQAQENWQKTFDANEAYRAQQQKNFDTTEARLAEQARLNAENEKIRIDIAKQNANIQLKNALDKNKPYPMAVNGEIYEIPIKQINEQIIGSIFAKLPEEVRKSAGSPRYGKDYMNNPIIVGYNNPSLADMLAAIGTYGNEETAKEIMKLAGEKVDEVDPKKEERGKEGTTDFSQFKRK